MLLDRADGGEAVQHTRLRQSIRRLYERLRAPVVQLINALATGRRLSNGWLSKFHQHQVLRRFLHSASTIVRECAECTCFLGVSWQRLGISPPPHAPRDSGDVIAPRISLAVW